MDATQEHFSHPSPMLPDSLTDALLGLMLTKKEGNEAREQKNTIDGKGWSERKKRKNKYFCQFLVRSKFNKKRQTRRREIGS